MRAPPGAAVLTLARSALPRGMGQRNEETRGGVGKSEQGTGANRGNPCLDGRNGSLLEDSKTLLRDPHPVKKRRCPTTACSWMLMHAHPHYLPLWTRYLRQVPRQIHHVPFFPMGYEVLLGRWCSPLRRPRSVRPASHFHRRTTPKVTQAASAPEICGLRKTSESTQLVNECE